jgi:hypothetical protein
MQNVAAAKPLIQSDVENLVEIRKPIQEEYQDRENVIERIVRIK